MLRMQSSIPAVPESVTRIRHEVADLAARAGIDGEHLDAIRLAVSEAVTNAVLYAYGADDGQVHATAELAGDELWVLIADDGRGIHAGAESLGLGLGLALMSEVCDGFTIVERARWRHRAATALHGPRRGRGRPAWSTSLTPRKTASLPAIRRCRSRSMRAWSQF